MGVACLTCIIYIPLKTIKLLSFGNEFCLSNQSAHVQTFNVQVSSCPRLRQWLPKSCSRIARMIERSSNMFCADHHPNINTRPSIYVFCLKPGEQGQKPRRPEVQNLQIGSHWVDRMYVCPARSSGDIKTWLDAKSRDHSGKCEFGTTATVHFFITHTVGTPPRPMHYLFYALQKK